MQTAKRDRAVVVGAGMGGLLAARVLSESFRQVLLLERDNLPSAGEQRRGLPQGRHTHCLLASGRRTLEELFPGVTDRLLAAGAIGGDVARDARFLLEGGCLARCVSGLDVVLLSRPLLEGMIRDEVGRIPNIDIRQNCQAERLAASPDKRRVTGVRFAGQSLPADLVVDAAGRCSDASAGLLALGYDAPDEERVEIGLAYTTRVFRREPRHLDGDLGVFLLPASGRKRGGIMLAQEGGRWTVSLITRFSTEAPGELPGFIEFAKTLPAPYIYDVVAEAEPVGEPATTRFPASIRRRFERLKHFPEGFLVFGDAICSVNPIYGQGMSTAALEAVELRRALREGPANLAPRFFKQAARVIDTPWSIAVNNDLRMSQTIGPRGAKVKFTNWYLSKLYRAARQDAALSVACHRVANLVDPPPSVMRPSNLLRVFREAMRASEPGPVPAHPVKDAKLERRTVSSVRR
jgi:2-polyprenyl-6-methoxyphenol hydroxylase-like FAD-dependent oxidoreductase